MIENKEYQGFLDAVEKNRFIGWAREVTSNSVVNIVVAIGDLIIKQVVADNFRSDLKDSGIADGKFGFDFSISNASLNLAKESKKGVSLFIENINGFLIAEVNLSNGILNKEAQQLFGAIAEEYICATQEANIEFDKLLDIPKSSFQRSLTPKVTTPLLEKMFVNSANKSDASEYYTFQRKPSLSPYLEFCRHRFRAEKMFDVNTNTVDIDNFYMWYVEFYNGTQRKFLKPPFSRIDLEYLNELIILPGCTFQLSRVHFYYILKHNPNINFSSVLNDVAQYTAQVFDWTCKVSVQLNVDDCLIPKSYKALMSSMNTEWMTKPTPLTLMSEHYFNRDVSLHFLHLDNEFDRKVYYGVLLMKAIEEPILLCAVPQKIIISYFSSVDGELNLLQKLILENCGGLNKIDSLPLDNFSKANYSKILLSKGFNLDNSSYSSIDSVGNRIESNKYIVDSSEQSELFDVQLIGPINKASGLGQATRLSADILAKTNLKVNLVDFGLDNPAKEGFNSTRLLGTLAKSKVNLIHLNAESLPTLLAFYPDVFSDSYNIGYFYWELDSPAACHRLAMQLVDEIWVSTDYGVKQYQPFSDKPVTNVGMAYEPSEPINKQSAKSFLSERYSIESSSTVFLVTFDSFSFPERKNPIATIKAFQRAFQSNENVRMILKTQNRDFIVDKKQIGIWDQINHLTSIDSRIIIINETLSYPELLKLKAGCDCYVSLHRSEGWGFGMIEAMGLGVAVIATNYSGNLEFCNQENSWLIDYELKFADTDDYVYVKAGQRWAEPSIESASKAIREAYENPKLRAKKADAGKKTATSDFSLTTISKRYSKRLSSILNK
ncbi:glycosyltransferase [Paraglaciecola sp. L1A13]|uniref:glycosyltransferase n=1 Tax=Paraglaciecola sp. L1A13 TaxID=2686359 RepID=UPI00131C5F55|nr:glycosyltransferase [Paraglaciecola sp. L1A13]